MEGWHVSQYNKIAEEKKMPAKIGIYDTTLRDGEQTINVAFSKEEKLQIARQLDAVGVKRIEIGMPVVSNEDREAATMIVNAGLKAETWGFCRCNVKDVQACVDTGVKHVICEIATSEEKMKAYGIDRKTVMQRMMDAITFAKEHDLYVAFFGVDATRAQADFLEEMYKAAIFKAHADEAVIVDTLGVATPEAMYYLTKKVKEWVGVPVMAHCHNDFGLGVAGSIASVMGGAEYVHVCVNGLGEKTGNADLAEIAVASMLYGTDTGIDLKGVYNLAKLVEKLSKITISPLKPVVGDNVFKRESGVTVAQLVKYPPSCEGYSAEMVGRSREVLLSKKSGKASIEYALGLRGLSWTDEQLDGVLHAVKDLGVQQKHVLTDEQFDAIVKKFYA